MCQNSKKKFLYTFEFRKWKTEQMLDDREASMSRLYQPGILKCFISD